MIDALFAAIDSNTQKFMDKGTDIVVNMTKGITRNSKRVINAVGTMIVNFLSNVADAIDKYAPQIREQGFRIGVAILDGMTGGLASKAGNFASTLFEVATSPWAPVTNWWMENSPSKRSFALGKNIVQGMINAFNEGDGLPKSAVNLSERTMTAFQESMAQVSSIASDMDEFNPTVTPVLDMSQLQKDAKAVAGFFPAPNLVPAVGQAQQISYLAQQNREASIEPTTAQTPTEVSFEQNIYAPKQLSTVEIYRQTRSQITLAKEELSIP